MRDLSAGLAAHIAGETLTLATCWKITRRDGEVLGFTDHDADLTITAVTYKAATGFTRTAVQSKADFSVGNLEVEGMISSDDVAETDLLNGRYDYAEVEIFIVNYASLGDGNIEVKRGFLGEVKVSRGKFVAELRGLAQLLAQRTGLVYAASCNAVLGDARCTLSLGLFTGSATVTGVTDNAEFATDAVIFDSNFFAGGELVWTSGANDGLRMEVKELNTDGVVTLALPMGNGVQPGDTFDVIAGCDKTRDTCKVKFDNLANFRGFPDVPGMDKILETPGTAADLRKG